MQDIDYQITILLFLILIWYHMTHLELYQNMMLFEVMNNMNNINNKKIDEIKLNHISLIILCLIELL